ncbi:MAG: NUDIX hydrolase [Jatrophihabitantaceae bacterium]
MSGDGNGWARCSASHLHWGRFGAAGILITDGSRVVLQHRAAWTHEGGTWAVPGGALDSHENAVTAAMREVQEETTVDPELLEPFAEWVDDHGGWSYTTVLARATGELAPAIANPESDAVQWWAFGEVDALRLHAGFAAAWPELRALIELSSN